MEGAGVIKAARSQAEHFFSIPTRVYKGISTEGAAELKARARPKTVPAADFYVVLFRTYPHYYMMNIECMLPTLRRPCWTNGQI